MSVAIYHYDDLMDAFHDANSEDSHPIMIMRKCNVYAISLCILSFDFEVRLHFNWKSGLLSSKIASRLCNSLQTDGSNKPHRCEAVITAWLLNEVNCLGGTCSCLPSLTTSTKQIFE